MSERDPRDFCMRNLPGIEQIIATGVPESCCTIQQMEEWLTRDFRSPKRPCFESELGPRELIDALNGALLLAFKAQAAHEPLTEIPYGTHETWGGVIAN